MPRADKSTALALAASCLLTGALSAESPPAYHVTKTVMLGQPDRWDYVVFDAASHRVYVSHGDQVAVVDGRTGEMLGRVEGAPGGTHGIAIATASGRGYTDDGRAGEALSFDLTSFKVEHRIKAA